MTLETLISQYGYVAILAGTFLEGETILVMGGVAAHQGYLSLPGVMLAALAGSTLGDQLFYYLGRRHSEWLLARFRSWRPRIHRAQRMLDRYETLTILGFRFVYGMRTVTPFFLGISRVSYLKFAALNILGALLWSVAVGSLGYAFGSALKPLLGRIKHYEMLTLGTILLLGAALWLLRLLRRRKALRERGNDDRTAR